MTIFLPPHPRKESHPDLPVPLAEVASGNQKLTGSGGEHHGFLKGRFGPPKIQTSASYNA